MRRQVMQFAEKYRAGIERLSARVRESIRHPSLFVFVGDCDEAYSCICTQTREIFTGGVFFLRLFTEGAASADTASAEAAAVEAERAIRTVKTEIQRNENHLNIKRVNIYVITQASCPHSEWTEIAGKRLKDIFIEDFSIVHTTLFLLLSESNRWEDFERRSALSLRMLRAVEDFQRQTALFNLVFLLSDRNENDVVSDENRQNNYQIITHFHGLTHAESRFEDSLQKKSMDAGTPFFVTAGMARLEKPNEAIAYAVFRHVFETLLAKWKERAASVDPGNPPVAVDVLMQQIMVKMPENVPPEKLIRDMMSVASRETAVRALRGRTLREAEDLLFGEGAARFFEKNYSAAQLVNTEEAYEIVAAHLARSAEGPYGMAVCESYIPADSVNTLEQHIEQKEQEIALRYQKGCGSLLLQGTDAVKRMVAEVYAERYALERLRAARTALRCVADGLANGARRSRRLVKTLEQARKELQQADDPGQHITAYYEQVVNGIMTELSARYGPDFVFEEICAEPVAVWLGTDSTDDPDLLPLAEKIAAFIEKYIFTHESMHLSFDEDLQRRSQMAPGAYDSEFTDIEEFYRRMLAEADRQAALAVSLQRYDDLIFEKYYFGDKDGMFMRYVRQLSGGNLMESVLFLEETSGFKVIRLAGGFTPESLTRYRTMQTMYKKVFS